MTRGPGAEFQVFSAEAAAPGCGEHRRPHAVRPEHHGPAVASQERGGRPTVAGRRCRGSRCRCARRRHPRHGPRHAAEPRGLVEVPLTEDRGPRDTRVVLHRVEVDTPRVERLRRVVRDLVERGPGDGRFDRVPLILVRRLLVLGVLGVERALHDDRARDLRVPVLVPEGAVRLRLRRVVRVIPRVKLLVLRVDLDLVVVLVVPLRVDHQLDGVLRPELGLTADGPVLRLLVLRREVTDDLRLGHLVRGRRGSCRPT